MARRSGRGGYVAISAGSPTAVPDATVWAASTTYVLDNVVQVTTGADTSVAVCVLPHESTAGGLTAAADGAIAGTDAANWEAVETGTLVALRNWTFDISEQTETETYVRESEDRTVGTSVTTTGQIVVADNDEDGFDEAQRALTISNQFTMRLFPKGQASGRPVWTGTARITGESGAFSTTTQERTFAFAIQGSWTRTRQA